LIPEKKALPVVKPAAPSLSAAPDQADVLLYFRDELRALLALLDEPLPTSEP
jgi:hypothetical protein